MSLRVVSAGVGLGKAQQDHVGVARTSLEGGLERARRGRESRTERGADDCHAMVLDSNTLAVVGGGAAKVGGVQQRAASVQADKEGVGVAVPGWIQGIGADGEGVAIGGADEGRAVVLVDGDVFAEVGKGRAEEGREDER